MQNPYDTNTDIYLQDIQMISPEEIIAKNTKNQILNNIKASLEELLNIETLKDEPDSLITSAICTNLSILEDAYSIDMYKFQFKAFTNILRVEIKNIKDIINLTT
jgi:hypothetical protein